MAGEGTKRIVDLTEAAETQSGDYFAIDSTGRGTRKLPAGFMATAEDLSEEQTERQTADATLDGKITAEAQARLDADNAIDEQITALDEKTEADAALIQNPTKTISGALVSFTDGAAMPAKSVIVNIEPKQSGTGTPSPDNVRQISGWESVNLFDTGVNVWDEEWEIGWIRPDGLNAGGVDNIIRSVNYIPVSPNTEYYFNTPDATDIVYFDADKNSLGNFDKNGLGDTSSTSRIRCTQDNCFYIRFWVRNQTTYNNDISVNYPSTDTEYHAYNPNSSTTPVSLGRTAYGGTLDVVSGVLTAYPFYPSYNGETLDGRWICDRAVYAEGTTPPTGSQVALISGTGTTYQLTPTEVKTLLGENNVWADSGDVEITYRRDISIVINNLESALNG